MCHTCIRFGKCVNPSVIDVGTTVYMCADGHVSDKCALRDVRNPSVNPLVNVAQSRNFFATLCEILTSYISSAIMSVNVAQSRNVFATLCEIPTGYIPSVMPSVSVAQYVIVLQLSVRYRRVVVCR
jgi:hypothetical protein